MADSSKKYRISFYDELAEDELLGGFIDDFLAEDFLKNPSLQKRIAAAVLSLPRDSLYFSYFLLKQLEQIFLQFFEQIEKCRKTSNR